MKVQRCFKCLIFLSFSATFVAYYHFLGSDINFFGSKWKLRTWLPTRLYSKYLMSYYLELRYDEHVIQQMIKENSVSNNIVITTANYGFVDFLVNLLYSVKKNVPEKFKMLLIIAEDRRVFDYLKKYFPEHLLPIYPHPKAISAPVEYRTKKYRELAFKRPIYLQYLLQFGSNVLFMDADYVWVQDPFLYLNRSWNMLVGVDIDAMMFWRHGKETFHWRGRDHSENIHFKQVLKAR